MPDAVSNALSGLDAAALRLAVSAENVAGGRQRAVQQTASPVGGVQTQIVPKESVELDLAAEAVQQNLSLQLYQANAAVIRTEKEATNRLLDTLV